MLQTLTSKKMKNKIGITDNLIDWKKNQLTNKGSVVYTIVVIILIITFGFIIYQLSALSQCRRREVTYHLNYRGKVKGFEWIGRGESLIVIANGVRHEVSLPTRFLGENATPGDSLIKISNTNKCILIKKNEKLIGKYEYHHDRNCKCPEYDE